MFFNLKTYLSTYYSKTYVYYIQKYEGDLSDQYYKFITHPVTIYYICVLMVYNNQNYSIYGK
ncbi:hypothetical protein IWQ47_000004 [Aquimarina sp. EL_43]|nr:hypothetical protein [Aquimarina sp. EL_35]MBG6150368.1 hypothetical protein [Aquimarina sp. EL_32]MBG6166946.1 hypothetical protein [Aquimarina sp. EL_43]